MIFLDLLAKRGTTGLPMDRNAGEAENRHGLQQQPKSIHSHSASWFHEKPAATFQTFYRMTGCTGSPQLV
jgi:hypothetical protein